MLLMTRPDYGTSQYTHAQPFTCTRPMLDRMNPRRQKLRSKP